MTQKPKIQYVGQFYVYGSEARALEAEQPRKPKFQLPIVTEKLEKIEKVYVDPVALIAIAVSVFMLATMILGVLQLQTDWEEYQTVVERLHAVRETNHTKVEQLRSQYTLSEIREKATTIGLVHKSQVEHKTVSVTVPEPEPEMTVVDNVLWFLKGLFA